MTALLTYSQQQAIKKISENNQGKFAQIETEVENLELRDLLGYSFLYDVQKYPSATWNKKLLEGDTFTDDYGNTIAHRGIYFVLAYFIYSKYVLISHVADTFTGFVTKNRTEAEPINQGMVKTIQDDNRKIALSEWELIKEYLNQNYTNFPYWNCANVKKPFTPKFKSLRTTVYGGNFKPNEILISDINKENSI